MNGSRPKSRMLAPAALLGLVLYACGAYGVEPGAPKFTFNGFGTLGVAHSSEKRADFAVSPLKPNGPGFTRAWSADVDSRIGGQVTAEFSRQLAAVVQVVAEQRYDNSYAPTVEWANVKYQVTPQFSVRAGRIVLPTFLVSDYRKVGYTYPWVRPPVELYAMIPVGSSDGVDVIYRMHTGNFTHTLQAIFGGAKVRIPAGGGVAEGKSARGITYRSEFGATTVHATYHKMRLGVPAYKPLFDGFRQFGAEGVGLADKYDVNDKAFTFISLGAMYDPGGWFVTGEWGLTESHSVVGRKSAWYVSGGYRLGDFTPYFTYARGSADKLSDPGLTVSALPPFLAGPAIGLNAALNDNLSRKRVQSTVSAGVRWDFMSNTAFKLQWDHTRIRAGSQGTLINRQPGFRTGGKVNVLSATIDFVF